MIIPTPAFSLYDTVTRMAGAVPAPVDTTENGFQLTAAALEAALTPKTKVLILNSPTTPPASSTPPGAPCRHRPADPRPGSVRPL